MSKFWWCTKPISIRNNLWRSKSIIKFIYVINRFKRGIIWSRTRAVSDHLWRNKYVINFIYRINVEELKKITHLCCDQHDIAIFVCAKNCYIMLQSAWHSSYTSFDVVRMGKMVSGWLCPYSKLWNFPDCAISMFRYNMTQTCSGMHAVRTPIICQAGLPPCGFIANGRKILPWES